MDPGVPGTCKSIDVAKLPQSIKKSTILDYAVPVLTPKQERKYGLATATTHGRPPAKTEIVTHVELESPLLVYCHPCCL